MSAYHSVGSRTDSPSSSGQGVLGEGEVSIEYLGPGHDPVGAHAMGGELISSRPALNRYGAERRVGMV